MLSQFNVNVVANKKRPSNAKPPYMESPINRVIRIIPFRVFGEIWIEHVASID